MTDAGTPPPRWDRENWRVLFIAAPGPGAVLRFLERRALAGDLLPLSVYLSEPTPPHGFRLLYSPNAARDLLTEMATRLTAAFPAPLTLLYRETEPEPVWGYRVWTGGEEGEWGEEVLPRLPLWQRWTANLPGVAATAPPVAFTVRRSLPLDHLPLLARTAVPEIEYRTVSTLDQRGLLVENSPCLYRFDLPRTNGPGATV